MKPNDQALDPVWVNFCRKRGVKPFRIDEEDIDLDSGLIESLMDALKNNAYDRSQPLVIANSNDASIHQEVVYGRHRIISAYRLSKKGIAVRFPPISQEDMKDIYELNCRIAHYVQLSGSKQPGLAKKIVECRIKDVIEAKIDQYGDKLPDQIVKMGFSSIKIVNKLLDEVKEKKQAKIDKRKTMKAVNLSLQHDFGSDDNWGISKRYPNESVHAKPGDKFDQLTSVRECPCSCKPPRQLTIVSALNDSILEVRGPEHAQELKK